jgi:hypothetical protein
MRVFISRAQRLDWVHARCLPRRINPKQHACADGDSDRDGDRLPQKYVWQPLGACHNLHAANPDQYASNTTTQRH